MSATARPVSFSFPPIASRDARLMILGSLPGAESLRQQRYYAKTDNAFWRIMSAIVGVPPDESYAERCASLIAHGIAVWDVCGAAERPGSLDAKIDRRSIVPNDFAAFFAAHPSIAFIGFNGKAAAEIYRVKVTPVLPVEVARLPSATLPSTSPAHAAMRFDDKAARWRAALTPYLR